MNTKGMLQKIVFIMYVEIEMEKLLGAHGGYRKLKTFQLAQLLFDITVRFCHKFIDRKSRTVDQMVQAARSAAQNIAEGSKNSATSKKSELKLTNISRGSLEELKLDYCDFLRQRKLSMWGYKDSQGDALIKLRITTADEFAFWAKEVAQQTQRPIEEVAANGVLVLISVTGALLDRQIKAQAEAFERDGGFTEKMYRFRQEFRKRSE